MKRGRLKIQKREDKSERKTDNRCVREKKKKDLASTPKLASCVSNGKAESEPARPLSPGAAAFVVFCPLAKIVDMTYSKKLPMF